VRIPADPKGLTVGRIARRGSDLVIYLSKGAFDPKASSDRLLAEGGAAIAETARGPESLAKRAIRVVGDRATPVAIGAFDGVIVHADEILPGVRSCNIYWSDDTSDWTVRTGFADPRDAIEFARSMVCG
jgi:hypothetical protein